jgi:hypothetical protein
MPSEKRRLLPVYLFEFAYSSAEFSHISFTVEADDMENVGVDAAIHAESQHVATRSAAPAAMKCAQAVEVLQECVDVVLAYLRGVEEGTTAPDDDLMRDISTLCHRLPASTLERSLAANDRNYVSGLLIVYLAVLQRVSHQSLVVERDTTSCGATQRLKSARR